MHPGTNIRAALHQLSASYGGVDKVPTDAVLSRLAKQDIFVEKRDVVAERKAMLEQSVDTAERLRTTADQGSKPPPSSHGHKPLDPSTSPLFLQAKQSEGGATPTVKRQMTHKPSAQPAPQLPSFEALPPSSGPKLSTPNPPSYVPPSFSPPSFGASSYRPPTFGPPSFGPPSFGPPSFGPPSFGPPVTTPKPPVAEDGGNAKKRRNTVLDEPSSSPLFAPKGPSKEELLRKLGGSAADDERLRAKVKKDVSAPVRREETVGYRRQVAAATVGSANRSSGARDAHFPGAVSSSVGHNNECASAAAQTALNESGASRKFNPGMLSVSFSPGTVDRELKANGFTASSFDELKGLVSSGKPFVAWVNGPSLDGGGQHAYCVKPNGSGGLVAWDPDSAEGGVRKLALDRRFFDSVYLAPSK